MDNGNRVRAALAAALFVIAAGAGPRAQTGSGPSSIDDFFATFTDTWVRASPNQAIVSRYFTGAGQDALETQITPLTRECRRRRLDMARRGLADLAKIDVNRISPEQRDASEMKKSPIEV